MILKPSLAAAAAAFLLVQPALAQTPSPLAGAWERTVFIDASGKTQPQQPAFFVFTGDGHFVQSVVPAGRPKATKPVPEMTKEELLGRFQGLDFRFGTYTTAAGKITFHDVANINSANEGREQVRLFHIDRDVLTITAEGQTGELQYRRMPAVK